MAPMERYFGPEVVDVDVGGQLVRELKAATAFLVGTAPIHEVHATAEEQSEYVNKKILIRREADIAKHFGPWRDGYTIPQKLKAMFSKSDTRGIGTICVVNVFDPAVHKDGGGNPDPSQVTALDIIGAFDAAGTPSGLKLAYACYQYFGWFPKHILAPGFDAMTGVRGGDGDDRQPHPRPLLSRRADRCVRPGRGRGARSVWQFRFPDQRHASRSMLAAYESGQSG